MLSKEETKKKRSGKNTQIKIGNNVHISAGCYFYGNSGNITLEDYTCTSARCILYTANDDYTEGYATNSVVDESIKKVTTGDIHIKKHSVIGCNSVILPNVVLEHATSVGSHSLLKINTNVFDIVAGVPAKFIDSPNVQKLAKGARVFVMGENENFLVQNSNDYFKYLGSDGYRCQNPISLAQNLGSDIKVT